ncbi:prokaryotic phospholipase A2-domain-containing protein [Plectosphaerella plurivora]|uniref:Prokaryotic phospholipase A2-domain-containing protein n=1 Tax=Plectosphaerella plurivora TaxID=936078 RepID=A0A9P8VE20_9PEZI|nr:prokaryotic phospholipase A2-domain-containing protein [Plectosphaerella plurivora]
MKLFLITFLAILATIVSAMPTSSPIATTFTLVLRELETGPKTKRPAWCVCTPTCVHNLTFKTSLLDFEKHRNSRGPKSCNWESSGCPKIPGKTPMVYNFEGPCHRREFAYRNMRAQGRFTEDMKRHIDRKFGKDLGDSCRHQVWPADAAMPFTFFITGLQAMTQLPACLAFAKTIETSQVLFGSRDFNVD